MEGGGKSSMWTNEEREDKSKRGGGGGIVTGGEGGFLQNETLRKGGGQTCRGRFGRQSRQERRSGLLCQKGEDP